MTAKYGGQRKGFFPHITRYWKSKNPPQNRVGVQHDPGRVPGFWGAQRILFRGWHRRIRAGSFASKTTGSFHIFLDQSNPSKCVLSSNNEVRLVFSSGSLYHHRCSAVPPGNTPYRRFQIPARQTNHLVHRLTCVNLFHQITCFKGVIKNSWLIVVRYWIWRFFLLAKFESLF